MTLVKICGLKTAEAVDTACNAGANLLGFVFYPNTPRYVTPETMAALAARVPAGVLKVGLVVDATDAELDAITAPGALDVLQLHGHETTERVADVQGRYGLDVMKALPIATPEDVDAARAFEAVADRLLFDAKPPSGATRPGGNARAFDWGLLAGTGWSVPWLLAGGLTPGNVADAVQASGAPGVDVSSGVETTPGEKDMDKIRRFIAAAKAV